MNNHPSSFRDPDGFIFEKNNQIFRQINNSFKEDYDHYINSGLYELLLDKELVTPHEEVASHNCVNGDCYKILHHNRLDFVSYPYEWPFSALKDAALVTLEILELSIKKDMILKDASAFNVQFHNGKMKLIDTGSFSKLKSGEPWVAYNQFCKHFLAPLALMSKKDICLSSLFIHNIDGIPLDLACKLLPFSSRFNFGLLIHLFVHSKTIEKFSNNESRATKKSKIKITKTNLLALCDSLKSCIKSLKIKNISSEWGDYYRNNNNYSDQKFSSKQNIVEEFTKKISPHRILDLGANRGDFSRIVLGDNVQLVLSADIDPIAVEDNYLQSKKEKNKTLIPIKFDFTNPTPAIGWENKEREDFISRVDADLVLALALIHHMAISNNLPLNRICDFFSKITKNYLIIEFIEKEDSQVKKILLSRKDIFKDYNKKHFESEFSKFFEIIESKAIEGMHRTCYLMKKK